MSILNITFDLETCALCFTAAVMSIEAVAWNANAEDNPFTDGFSGDYCFIATLTCAYRSSTDLLAAPAALQSARKTTNGIVADVPIDDYMALMQMKIMTSHTLKDLALQAIHEFVKKKQLR